DATHDFARAVKVDSTPAQVVTGLHVADVLQVNRLPILLTDNQEIEFLHILAVDDSAQLIFTIRHLNRAAPHFLEGASNAADHLFEGNAFIGEQRRKDLDLILLLKSSDGSKFGHARHGLKRGLDLALV